MSTLEEGRRVVRQRSTGAERSRGAGLATALLCALFCGCIGGRFATKSADPIIDPAARVLIERITAARSAVGFPAATWVPQLVTPAFQSAKAVARGDQPLRAAARSAAMGGVTEVGRHVWAFATECVDLAQFTPPPLVTMQKALPYAVAAVASANGRQTVILLVGDPGPSALRAEQMGGGHGGSNPVLETYAHPSVATGLCGKSWPAAARHP